MYQYGLIGNCQASALVHVSGSVHWFCAPLPDSPPVFGRLLDSDGGEFSIEADRPISHEGNPQRYLTNTNVLVTTIRDEKGAFRITDFFPRFEQHGRMYRPVTLIRIVEPIEGSSVIRVRCRPVSGWEKSPPKFERGNQHIRFDVRGEPLRLLTSMSLTRLCEETSFELTEPVYFALSWGVGIEADLATVANEFLERTIRYWRGWVKHCSIPSLFQKETIRSALALKLHCYEDTGAILAALTTSLPEERGSNRNWDYRFCWLRDSYFTLSAFHRLGHFEEMEGFLKFLLGIVHSLDRVRPVYKIDGSMPLPENTFDNWMGYESLSRPVRGNNEAASHVQNDVFGEMLLTLSPIYFDERFEHLRHSEHDKLLTHLAAHCEASIGSSDAGLWELRHGIFEHTFTNLMCWAGLDRAACLQERGYLKDLGFDAKGAVQRARDAVVAAAKDGALRTGPRDPSFDAAMLQAAILRFPDPIARHTVNACYQALRLSSSGDGQYYLFRYRKPDDFGVPQSAFLLCSFWWVQALAKIGEIDRAREVLSSVLAAANHLGLLSEHFSPQLRMQLGNFPQAYSHVGEINAAFAVSPPWDEVL